jgi:hypothetical protein
MIPDEYKNCDAIHINNNASTKFMLVYIEYWHEISLWNAKRPGNRNKFSAFLDKEYSGHSKYVRTTGPPCKQVPCNNIVPVHSDYKPKMKLGLTWGPVTLLIYLTTLTVSWLHSVK